MPCLSAFCRDRLLPSSVLGPVDSCALRRFAAVLLLNETTLSCVFSSTMQYPRLAPNGAYHIRFYFAAVLDRREPGLTTNKRIWSILYFVLSFCLATRR